MKEPSKISTKLLRFIQYHTEQIVDDGAVTLFRKICTLLLMPFAMVTVLILRALKPWIIVRLGCLFNSRFGHFILEPELYCCYRDVYKVAQRTLDIFYYNGFITNQQLKKMWSRVLHTCWFAKEVDRLNRLFPYYEKHVIPLLSAIDVCHLPPGYREADRQRDSLSLLARAPVHLFFTAKEEEKGRRALREMGIPKDAPFVCIYGRDHVYLEKAFPKVDWSYQAYRDSKICNYISAALELIRRGYFVIRMGYMVQDELKIENPMIIDYAARLRTDFLDMYLPAKCTFFLGVPGGLVGVPMVFRRPIAYVDSIPIEYVHCWNPNEILIIKKLWLRKECRFLTIREILESGAGGFKRKPLYEQMGIEIVDNTPEEITALAIEMEERLNGTWQTTEEDERLQRQFWSFFKSRDSKNIFATRVGREFLRQNQALLQ